MPNSFEELMSKKSDEQLLKIVAGRPEDYQPEALDAAQRELAKRNLSQEQFTAAKHEVVKEKAREEVMANIPLEGGVKALSFLFPGVMQMMFSSTYRASGFQRKANELIRWTVYGIIFYTTVFIIIFMMN